MEERFLFQNKNVCFQMHSTLSFVSVVWSTLLIIHIFSIFFTINPSSPNVRQLFKASSPSVAQVAKTVILLTSTAVTEVKKCNFLFCCLVKKTLNKELCFEKYFCNFIVSIYYCFVDEFRRVSRNNSHTRANAKVKLKTTKKTQKISGKAGKNYVRFQFYAICKLLGALLVNFSERFLDWISKFWGNHLKIVTFPVTIEETLCKWWICEILTEKKMKILKPFADENRCTK